MNLRPSAALVTLALLAACAGDTTGLKSKLTADEAVALAMALNSQASNAGSASAATASRVPSRSLSLNSVPSPVNASVDVTGPCPRGGTNHLTFTLAATVDPQAQSVLVDMTGKQAPNDCGFDTKKNVVVHITGTPDLTHTAHLAAEAGHPVGTWTSTLKGSFDWRTSDDRSGSCTVDWSTEANYATMRVKIDGTFCGSTFHFDGPITQGQGTA